PPLDVQYFTDLQNYAKKHSGASLYNDFVDIYNRTNKAIESATLDHIEALSQKYGTDALELEIIFTIIYAGMVAEENKAFTMLGKKIKRLGVHQVLMENLQPNYA